MNPIDTAPAAPVAGGRGKALAALVGLAVAAALLVDIPADEGRRRAAYRDLAGVLTICDGDTQNVAPGMVETEAGCDRRLEKRLAEHAKPVLACVPGLRAAARENQLRASVRLAYNIGPAAFCRSTAARRFNAGEWRAGCDAFLMWNRAGGRVVRGLALRRQRERALCLSGLPLPSGERAGERGYGLRT